MEDIKIFCYIDEEQTPYLININRQENLQICLSDLKEAYPRLHSIEAKFFYHSQEQELG